MTMDRIKKIMPASVIICLAVFFFGRVPKGKSMNLENVPIEHETEFGGCYITITIDDFLGLGYRFGDSVRVEFSNGYVLESLPFLVSDDSIDLQNADLVPYAEAYLKSGGMNDADIEALKNTIMN